MGQDKETVAVFTQADTECSNTGLEMATKEGERIAVLVDRMMFCYNAGQTKRWHTSPYVIREETIAAHTWNVVMFILLLHPEPSKNLIFAAMVHDAAEHFTGDMPRWTKQQKGLRGILSELEAEVLESKQLLCDLDEPDTLWLEAADLLDAWLFLRQNVLAGNRLMQPDYERATRTLRTMDCPIEIRNVFEFLLWRNT